MHAAVLAQQHAPSVGEFFRILTLRAGYNATLVLVGATLLGVAAGAIGAFALLRKRALMGDALSHATLPGIALAFIISTALGGQGRSLPVLLLGAAASGVVGVITVQLITRHSRIREDAAIGIVLSTFFGFGAVLITHIQTMTTGTQGGLTHFILGQTAAMQRGDAITIAAVAFACLAGATLFFKEFRVVCFDREYAAAQGWPVERIDLVMMAIVIIVTVIGLQTVGLILIVAMLIIPAASARFWSDRLSTMTALSAVLGGLSGALGASASAMWSDMPAGAVIVLVAGSLFALSFLVAPRRGVVASAARRIALRWRIAIDHALRILYEDRERARAAGDESRPMHVTAFARARAWSALSSWLALRALALAGDAARHGDRIELTEKGLARARQVTRNHRLWEQFLISHAHLAPSHVDRAADMVEHILAPDMIRELEKELDRAGVEVPEGKTPPSPHPIDVSVAGGAS